MFALLNRLMAVLALCGAVEADTGIEDTGLIELNPSEYVPLEVGNSWTYEHVYLNDLYMIGGEYEQEHPFDIPGYLPGSTPDSLRFVENIVTVEITHTEVIDGLEYFVFSDADYAWPPLPEFFWGGKKVRLSDEGFLVLRWEGQDITVYGFGHHGHYTRTLPIGFGTAEVRFSRSYAPYQLSSVSFRIGIDPPLDRAVAGIIFLQDYGIGQVYIEEYGLSSCTYAVFRNELTPISAVISGREIVHEQVRLSYQSFESTGLGQVAQVRMGEGFDFSEKKHSESSNDLELVSSFFGFFMGAPSGKSACQDNLTVDALSSETGIADLGKTDFGFLISKGIPPDAQLNFVTHVDPPGEGHTYAVRSREGGVALLYVFDVEYSSKDYKNYYGSRSVEDIKFDWIYYPSGKSAADTGVQPISWGQLKQLIPKQSRPSQDRSQVGRIR